MRTGRLWCLGATEVNGDAGAAHGGSTARREKKKRARAAQKRRAVERQADAVVAEEQAVAAKQQRKEAAREITERVKRRQEGKDFAEYFLKWLVDAVVTEVEYPPGAFVTTAYYLKRPAVLND